jgi:hypothetical protein
MPGSGASETTHELSQGQLKRPRENLLGAQARLFFPFLQVRNKRPSEPRVNGKIGLGPAPFLAELPHAPPEPHTDIFGCHALSMAVFFGLHFAYRIQSSTQEAGSGTDHVSPVN